MGDIAAIIASAQWLRAEFMVGDVGSASWFERREADFMKGLLLVTIDSWNLRAMSFSSVTGGGCSLASNLALSLADLRRCSLLGEELARSETCITEPALASGLPRRSDRAFLCARPGVSTCAARATPGEPSEHV